MNYKNKENGDSPNTFLRFSILGALVGLALIILILSLMALIMSFGILPIKVSPLLSSISVAIGAFLGGIFAAKKMQKNGLLIGSATGGILFIIFSLISLLAFKSAPGGATLIRGIIFIISASVGGIIGVGSDEKRKII